MALWKIMGCVVFNLIPTPCKSDYILSIMIIIRIKYIFMGGGGSHILNAALETLETRKSRCHSLRLNMSGCVTNANYTHKSSLLYLFESMSKFSMILHFYLMKGI